MTSVGSSTQSLTYSAILANAQRQAQAVYNAATSTGTTNPATPSNSNATTITLSDAAKAALAGKDFATVVTDARATLDALLTGASVASPLDADGKPVIDLAKVDRRELYAMSSSDQFTDDEQQAAELELRDRFDAAMAGPTAVARVTGAIKGLYTAALAYLDTFGPEEKASANFAAQKAALETGLEQLASDPTTLPSDNPDDPVLAYMDRLAAGETGEPRAFADVTSDARAALDQQYVEAAAAGKQLVFDRFSRSGQRVDFSDFDSRSLSAIALNSDDSFSSFEVGAAKSEIRQRNGAAVLAGLNDAGSSSDPSAFSRNLISMYGSMSAEERTAAGWTPEFYNAAVSNYQSSVKLASILSSLDSSASAAPSGSGSMNLLDYL